MVDSRDLIMNRVFAINLACWAGLSLLAMEDGEHGWLTVRFCIACLHACAAWLFWNRQTSKEETSFGNLALCLPSICTSGLMLGFAPPLPSWSAFSVVAFAVGTLLTLLSFLSLGRSFAVLPARRKIRQTAAYSVVRHPIYASELLLLLACWTTDFSSAWLAAGFLISVIFLIIRIRVEENLLNHAPEYNDYCSRVKWRIVPGLW